MALTKLNNKAIADVTALPSSVALGDMVLVSSATASGSASITFTLGDYKEYQFYFVNIHPSTDNTDFMFNVSIDSGSNYNVAKTTTQFRALHAEANNDTNLQYFPSHDLAQSTAFQTLISEIGNENDETAIGTMSLFNPSSTTFVKHYISRLNSYASFNYSIEQYSAGYGNTTSALTNIRFQMSSGNIDAGTILMYGIN